MLFGVNSFSGLNHGQMRKSWQGVSYSTAVTSAVTFSGVAIGPAYPDRYVLVAIATHEPGGIASFYDTLTCNGVTMQWLASAAGPLNDDPTIEFYISAAEVPSGTTCTIVCNNQVGKDSSRTTIGVWAVGGLSNNVSNGFTATQGNGTNISANSTTKEGGITFSAVAMKTASVTVTWGGSLGFTKEADGSNNNCITSFASVQDRPANAAGFTVTGSTNDVGDSVVCVSYIPG